MCLRLRQAGWTICRIDGEMTLHEAQMSRFSQWWRRSIRAGHAFAEGAARHGRTSGFRVREVRSILFWTLAVPALALAGAWWSYGLSLLLLPLGYGVLWLRVRRHRIARGDVPRHAGLYATFTVLGKFAQLVGVARYWLNRLRGRRTQLIEYKHAPAPAAHGGASHAA